MADIDHGLADDVASQEEASKWLEDETRKEKYGTTSQQLITGLEGAANAATFGLSTGIERALGVPAENIRARREENPISHGVGAGAGLIGSLAIPGVGAANLMERAGAGAAEALGLGAAETAAAKITSSAVKGAVENLMFQSGDEVAKMLSSDPSQTVGTAAANVGLSGLIGGVFGAGVGAVNPLWEATLGRKTTAALRDLSNETEHLALNGAYSALPEEHSDFGMFSDLAGNMKPNANEIVDAGNRLGIKPTTGSLSDSQAIQDLENNLLKRPTIAGQKLAKETDEIFKGLTKASAEVLREATNKTEAEVGREIKSGLIKKLNEELSPIEAKYDSLKPHLQNIELPVELKQAASSRILSHELAQFGGEGAAKAEAIVKRLDKIQNLDQLKSYRTLINEQIGKAVRQGGGEELQILNAAKSEINSLREAAIESASKSTGIGEKDAANISSEMIEDLKANDKAYRAYKDKLKSVGREAGIGKIGSARQLLEKLKASSDEAFASKVFDLGDINQLNYFKENFPKEFEIARRYKLKEIAEKSIDEAQGKNGKLSVGKFLRQISDSKLNPEAKEILFAGNTGKIKDIETMFRALPGNANPSGTAAALAYGNLFSMQGLSDNASDAVKYAILKNTPRLMKAAESSDAKATGMAALMFLKAGTAIEAGPFKAAVNMISAVLKADSKITKGVSNIFKAGREVIPAESFSAKDAEKLDKKLKDLQSDFNPLFDAGGKVSGYMPEAGVHMSETAANAVNYLNSLRPVEDKKMPLDSKIKVSQPAKAAFHRALHIAENPLTVLQDIKDGTITASDILSLKTMYPGLYSNISQKLYNGIVNKTNDEEPVPYKTRIGISMFLGQPLDSTMLPSAIQSAQMAGSMSRPQPQNIPSQGQKGPGPHSMKALSKLPQSYATPNQARAANKLKS